jgi:hypothetical protein
MKITGRVEVLANGNLLLNKAGAKASGVGLSGQQAFERKPVMGDTGYHGSVEEPVMAQLEVTLTDRDDVSVDELARIHDDGTVVFRAANGGKAYILEGATCANNMEITAGEGETPVKFYGPYWTETNQ